MKMRVDDVHGGSILPKRGDDSTSLEAGLFPVNAATQSPHGISYHFL
jgi:hypothetical protein